MKPSELDSGISLTGLAPTVLAKLAVLGWRSPGVSALAPEYRDAAQMGSMHHDRLMLVFHQRGVQLGLADRKRLNRQLRGTNGRRLKQRDQSPIGDPWQPFDQLVVNEDGVFTGGLNTLQVVKGEWTVERNGGPRCPDGQS